MAAHFDRFRALRKRRARRAEPPSALPGRGSQRTGARLVGVGQRRVRCSLAHLGSGPRPWAGTRALARGAGEGKRRLLARQECQTNSRRARGYRWRSCNAQRCPRGRSAGCASEGSADRWAGHWLCAGLHTRTVTRQNSQGLARHTLRTVAGQASSGGPGLVYSPALSARQHRRERVQTGIC